MRGLVASMWRPGSAGEPSDAQSVGDPDYLAGRDTIPDDIPYPDPDPAACCWPDSARAGSPYEQWARDLRLHEIMSTPPPDAPVASSLLAQEVRLHEMRNGSPELSVCRALAWAVRVIDEHARPPDPLRITASDDIPWQDRLTLAEAAGRLRTVAVDVSDVLRRLPVR